MIEALMAIIFENIGAEYRDGDKAIFFSPLRCEEVSVDLRKIAQAIVDMRAEWEAA